MEPDLFDAEEGERLRVRGMELASRRGYEQLYRARLLAIRIAQNRPSREVTADDVGRVLKRSGYPCLGPAAGSLFKTNEWEFTGRFVKSARTKNHSRLLRVWRLK